MVAFTWGGTFTQGNDLAGISDLDLLFSGGTWQLYATTRLVPGISVVDLNITGSTLNVTQRTDFSGSMGMPDGAMLIDREGDWVVGLTGLDATGYGGYDVDAAGILAGAIDLTPTAGMQTSLTAGATAQIGGETYLFAAQYGSTQLASFRVTADLRLERQALATLGDGQANAVATAKVGAQDYVFAASGTQAAIDTFQIGANGALILVSPGGPETMIGLQDVRQLETVTLDGSVYLIAGSHGANALTVFEVAESGNLITRDHVIDDLTTRFDALTELAVTSHRGRTYVAAAGADDGISLFELVPGGFLLHLQTFADSLTTTLDNVSGLALAGDGDHLAVVVSSEAEAGVTLFTADLGAPGLALSGSNGGDSLVGSAQADRLAGLDGHDSLFGHAGDDILVDGRGRDTMTGGSGADRFVLTGDYQSDTIADFDPSADSIDLSGWEFLRTSAQITFETTATGASLTFGDEVLVIHSANGQSLTQGDFDLGGLLTSSHALFEGPTFLPVVTGTEAANDIKGNENDNLIEALGGNDTLNGREGADTLDGGTGIDLADYSRAKTAVLVDLSNHLLNEGEAAGDTFLAIEGLSGSDYDDILRADDSDNILCGRKGDDNLLGRFGRDHLMGEQGDDRLFGGKSGDSIDGGSGHDLMHGERGNDTMRASTGHDTLFGGHNRDFMWGGRGSDLLDGAGDNDRLDGGYGNDTMIGGDGADTFVFYSGRDRITDFADDVDKIKLMPSLWGETSYTVADVITLFADDSGPDTVLDFGNGNRLIIEGLQNADALLDDMVF